MWRAALRDAACAACDALPEIVRSGGATEAADRLEELDYLESADRRNRSAELSAHAIRCLFALLGHCDMTEEAEAAAVLLSQSPAAAAPDRAVPQALAELAEHHPPRGAAAPAGFTALGRHAAACLLARSAEPPAEPRDWVVEADIPCTCPSCRLLKSFCADPVESTLRLPLRKDLRRHVHGIIEDHGLDLTHETERIGRPYTLVCTKTRGAYERRRAQYAVDIAHMRLLARAASRASDAGRGGELRRLHASIEHGATPGVARNPSGNCCTSHTRGA